MGDSYLALSPSTIFLNILTNLLTSQNFAFCIISHFWGGKVGGWAGKFLKIRVGFRDYYVQSKTLFFQKKLHLGSMKCE